QAALCRSHQPTYRPTARDARHVAARAAGRARQPAGRCARRSAAAGIGQPIDNRRRTSAYPNAGADWPQATLDAAFDVDGRTDALQRALDSLCASAEQVVAEGATIIVISDRCIGERRAPIPMLLAVSAVHQHLLKSGQRMQASLIAEAGD